MNTFWDITFTYENGDFELFERVSQQTKNELHDVFTRPERPVNSTFVLHSMRRTGDTYVVDMTKVRQISFVPRT